MTKSRKAVMDRVKFNLDFIDSQKRGTGPFEITQLLSSFLLTLHLNWDDLEDRWDQLPQKGIVWPEIQQEGLQQPRQAIGKMRDALAHGLIVFEEDSRREIAAIHLWTCPDRQTVDWSARITVQQVGQMLDCFMAVSATHLKDFQGAKRKGEPCCQRSNK